MQKTINCVLYFLVLLLVWPSEKETVDDVLFSSLSCLSAIKAEDDHKQRLEIVQETRNKDFYTGYLN